VTMQMVTRADLTALFPGIDSEIDKVETWFDVPLRYTLRRDLASNHRPPVADAFSVYTSDTSARRIQTIMAMATKRANVRNSGPWPIFVYVEDGFLLEGWHRLIAFQMLGMEEIDVVLVERDAPVIDPSGFSPSDVVVEDGEWCFAARWCDAQIGHLRLNREGDGVGRHVDSAFVLPAFRRKGIARRLYDAADHFLTARGFRLVPSPAASLSTDAAVLWEKRGVKPPG